MDQPTKLIDQSADLSGTMTVHSVEIKNVVEFIDIGCD
jgi:hypothetical protein